MKTLSKIAYLLFFILCLCVKLPAQNETYNLAKYQLNVSSFNNIVKLTDYTFAHGGEIGIDYILSDRVKEKKNLKQINKTWKAGSNLSFYRYAGNHSGYLFSIEAGRQRTGNSGFISECNIMLGSMISHRELTDYELLPTPVNTFHFVYGINFGLGWNLHKKTDIPLGLMFMPHLYMQTPYKADNILRLGTELKISYYL